MLIKDKKYFNHLRRYYTNDDTTLTEEAKYSINFAQSYKKKLSFHSNGDNNYLFVNGTEINKFKGNDSEIKGHPLC